MKVDRETINVFERLAEETGVPRSEVVRQVIDLFRDSRRGELECPECGQRFRMKS